MEYNPIVLKGNKYVKLLNEIDFGDEKNAPELDQSFWNDKTWSEEIYWFLFEHLGPHFALLERQVLLQFLFEAKSLTLDLTGFMNRKWFTRLFGIFAKINWKSNDINEGVLNLQTLNLFFDLLNNNLCFLDFNNFNALTWVVFLIELLLFPLDIFLDSKQRVNYYAQRMYSMKHFCEDPRNENSDLRLQFFDTLNAVFEFVVLNCQIQGFNVNEEIFAQIDGDTFIAFFDGPPGVGLLFSNFVSLILGFHDFVRSEGESD